MQRYRQRYPLPFYRGPAAAIHADRRTAPMRQEIAVTWGVHTAKKLIALTFDDGPEPDWTPRVHEILDEHRVRATFFLVGQRALAHRDLLAGTIRRSGHEVANHTWAHQDLGRMDYATAREAIERGARAIGSVTGTPPVLLRPPYGHVAGSTLLVAADLGVRVVLWNRQMLESEYPDSRGLAEYVVASCTPGTILLAHDAGGADRLVAIRGLPDMITGLRARGYEFVTVSELLAEG